MTRKEFGGGCFGESVSFGMAGEANDGEGTLAKADVLVLDVNLPK